MLTAKCKRCDAEFQPRHVRRNCLQKYCSLECGRKWRCAGAEVACTQCGVMIWRAQHHLALTRNPFCGFKCYGKWQKTNENPERKDFRIWEKQRKKALERDNFECHDCGADEVKLIVHHIKPRGQGIPVNHRLNNLVTLCDCCHTTRHHKLEKRKEIE